MSACAPALRLRLRAAYWSSILRRDRQTHRRWHLEGNWIWWEVRYAALRLERAWLALVEIQPLAWIRAVGRPNRSVRVLALTASSAHIRPPSAVDLRKTGTRRAERGRPRVWISSQILGSASVEVAGRPDGHSAHNYRFYTQSASRRSLRSAPAIRSGQVMARRIRRHELSRHAVSGTKLAPPRLQSATPIRQALA